MDLSRHTRAVLVPAMLAVGVLIAGTALAACGGDDDGADSGGAAQSAPGNGIDRAFVADMTPHHESAVQMAEIAGQRGQSDFVKSLAEDITRTQNAEITTLRAIATKLDDAGVKAEDLGLSEDQMGMTHDVAMLRKADPFDREFIDMMIPHHQGAIRMAHAELAKGSSAEAKKLAEQIIAAQTREIEAMNKHRTEEFGAASPAGGVPSKDDKQDEDDGASMDHE